MVDAILKIWYIHTPFISVVKKTQIYITKIIRAYWIVDMSAKSWVFFAPSLTNFSKTLDIFKSSNVGELKYN